MSTQQTGHLIALKIDLAKIDDGRLFHGQNGAKYLDATIWVNFEPDKFGNCGMITQAVSQTERKAGVKGRILGNGKMLVGPGALRKKESGEPAHIASALPKKEDLPF